MAQMLQENWWILIVAAAILILVAWWLIVATRKTTVEREETGDEDASTAKRNQALIDAPPVAATAPEEVQVTEEAPAPAEPASAPAPSTTPAPSPAPDTSSADDLTRIKGLGPKLVALLKEQGITTFAQIAAWGDAEIDRIDAQLGRFQGRIRRDSWVEQAKLLAADDIAGYEGRFGSL